MITLHRHNQQYFKQINISIYLKIRINEKILLLSLGVLPNVNFFPLNIHLFLRELFSFKYASVFIAALMVY